MGDAVDSRELGIRIRNARERAGLKQGELGHQVGLDRTAVNKLESGVRKVTALELSDIARALGVRMSSFFAEPMPALVSHRSSQGLDTSESRIDYLLANLATDVEFVASLIPDLTTADDGISPISIPTGRPDSMSDAEALAVKTRALLGLDDSEPANDLVARAADLGLLVFSADLGVDTADAGTILLHQGGVSLVNSHNKVGRRRLAAAHELGHYVIADEYTIDWRVGGQAGDIESLLDRFARALLLPETGVRTRWTEWNEKHALRDLAVLLGSGFRVDMATLARRLQELGLIDSEQAATVRTVTTTQADIVEHGLAIPTDLEGTSLPARFQKAVLRALREDRISRERALDLLQDTFSDSDLPEPRPAREDEIWKYVS